MAQGLPLLQGGDELGRTQSGNNNAYCQDNALTWIDWENADDARIEFAARLVRLRRRFAQTRRRDWLSGEAGAYGRDVVWWHPAGREMCADDWDSGEGGFLGCLLAPVVAREPLESADASEASEDPEFLLILMNREADALDVRLPPGKWRGLCDTALEAPFVEESAEDSCRVEAHAVRLFSQKARACRQG
jgi:glycogen operon protein